MNISWNFLQVVAGALNAGCKEASPCLDGSSTCAICALKFSLEKHAKEEQGYSSFFDILFLPPNSLRTMDLRPDRFNVYLDDQGHVKKGDVG